MAPCDLGIYSHGLEELNLRLARCGGHAVVQRRATDVVVEPEADNKICQHDAARGLMWGLTCWPAHCCHELILELK